MNYKEKFIREISFSEVDFEWPYWSREVDNEGETIPNEVEAADEDIYQETESMSIDKAIQALQQLKQEGADQVI